MMSMRKGIPLWHNFARSRLWTRHSSTKLLISNVRLASTISSAQAYDHEYDVIVIGSGAGGLTTAITAALHGKQKVLVTEKTSLYGGTSAFSGGALWLPMNHLSLSQGYSDSRERVETYLRSTLKGEYNEDKISAYLDTVPEMCKWLEKIGATRFVPLAAPDYYASIDGAGKAGRTVLTAPYDGRRLGQMVKQVRYPLQGYCAFGSMQIDAVYQNYWTRPLASWKSFSYVTKSMLRYAVDYLRYGKGTSLCNGNALVGRLLESAINSGVTLWRNSPATEPIMDKGAIAGLIIEKDGKGLRIRARKGVVLASGGFARSAQLTREHLPTQDWTVTPKGNQGDGLRIGEAVGGLLPETPLIDRALYAPISEFRPRKGPVRTYPHLMGITKPGAIIVDGDGKRFANESAPYQDLGQAMVKAGVRKSYLIANKRHLRRYGMGLALPAPYPISHLVRRGYLITAPALTALAEKLKIDPEKLSQAVDRFNEFTRTGKDLDFHRGEGSYDKLNGDPDFKPNPCLAPLQDGPFFAVPMYLGTSITMYGLNTDKDARVLDAARQPLSGVYAVGADSNHFLNGKYPTGGLTLGPAMVFGYRAGLHLAAT